MTFLHWDNHDEEHSEDVSRILKYHLKMGHDVRTTGPGGPGADRFLEASQQYLLGLASCAIRLNPRLGCAPNPSAA